MASITRTIIFFCLFKTNLHSLIDTFSRINIKHAKRGALSSLE